MKKLVIALFSFSLCALGASAATSVLPDTVKTIENAQKVVITEDSTGVNVTVVGTGSDSDYRYTYNSKYAPDGVVKTEQKDWILQLPFTKNESSNRKKHTVSIISGGLGFGWIDALGDGNDFDMGHSYEIFYQNVLAVEFKLNRNQWIKLGFGLDWRNYKLDKNYRFYKTDEGSDIGHYLDGQSPISSRYKVFSILVPFSFKQRLYQKLTLDLGVVMNINTRASIKTKYMKDGSKMEEFSRGVNQNRITCDFMGTLLWNGCGWYVKYSPCNVIKGGFGPQINPLSTGFILFY